jgi:hypothetical protein
MIASKVKSHFSSMGQEATGGLSKYFFRNGCPNTATMMMSTPR